MNSNVVKIASESCTLNIKLVMLIQFYQISSLHLSCGGRIEPASLGGRNVCPVPRIELEGDVIIKSNPLIPCKIPEDGIPTFLSPGRCPFKQTIFTCEKTLETEKCLVKCK